MKIITDGIWTEEQNEFMYKIGAMKFRVVFYTRPMTSNKTREFIASY
ncbi:hypothetical protein [Sulfurimonas sp.]|nr:hypothetical protein [Sulfurimonas sp.]